MLIGENGILNKSQQTKTEQIKAELEEKLKLAIYEIRIEKKEKPIELNDITEKNLRNRITDLEIKIEVTEEKDDSASEVMTIAEDSSKIKYKEIRLTKNEVTAIFKIDRNMNLTKIEGGIEFLYTYHAEEVQGNGIEITISVQEAENGISEIEVNGTVIEDVENGTKEKIEIKYTVELGKEYKIKIKPVKGEAKEETILINITHRITNNLAEGLQIDNELTEIQHNQPYTAKIIEEDEYIIDDLTVTMGGEVLTKGIDVENGIINIENVTGNIGIIATSQNCPNLLEINSVYSVYTVNTFADTNVELVKNVLFDGNTNNGGTYKGVLLGKDVNTYIQFTVYKKIDLYAYGHLFVSNASSGSDCVVKKWNQDKFETYKRVPTNVTGNRYKLITLDKGTYRIQILGNGYYVTFDEWEVEKASN